MPSTMRWNSVNKAGLYSLHYCLHDVAPMPFQLWFRAWNLVIYNTFPILTDRDVDTDLTSLSHQ